MQTDQKRTCAACGADNPSHAGFCWQCYAPFAPAAPAATRAPGMPPTPNAARPMRASQATGSSPAPAPHRSGSILKVVAGVLVAIVVGAFVRSMLAPHYSVPETLSGEPRLHNQLAQQYEHDMAEQGKRYDVEFDAAIYGMGDTPDVFLVLANGTAEESADELFDDFLSGIESAGVTVDRAEAVTGTHEDAEYNCVPVSARITSVACIWREDRSVGMTLDATPDGDTTATLFAAYDATHA